MASATAGSPIQPRARPATVTPSWTAGRNSSMVCFSLRAVRAPGRPRAMSCWMRVSRTLTRANSAATKKLLARMKKATMITRKNIHSSINASVMGVRAETGSFTVRRLSFVATVRCVLHGLCHLQSNKVGGHGNEHLTHSLIHIFEAVHNPGLGDRGFFRRNAQPQLVACLLFAAT